MRDVLQNADRQPANTTDDGQTKHLTSGSVVATKSTQVTKTSFCFSFVACVLFVVNTLFRVD